MPTQPTCPYCGEPVSLGASQCGACGERLPASASIRRPVQASPPPVPHTPEKPMQVAASPSVSLSFIRLVWFAALATIGLVLCRVLIFHTAGAFAGILESFSFPSGNVVILSLLLPLWVAVVREWVPAARPNTTLLLLLVPAAAEVALSTWWWAAYVAVGLTTMDGRRRAPGWPFFVGWGVVSIALIVDVAVERSLSPGDLVIRVPYEVLVAFTGCAWAYACGAFGTRMLIRK